MPCMFFMIINFIFMCISYLLVRWTLYYMVNLLVCVKSVNRITTLINYVLKQSTADLSYRVIRQCHMVCETLAPVFRNISSP